MSTEQEHEFVPAIRDWLAATSDFEIPPGLSREEAHQRAREFLAAIAAGTVVPDQVEVDDDLKDVLWASVEEFDERPIGQPNFEECDRFYQFVVALRVENDPFDERDEVLHRVARIGWRSAPGGVESVLTARSAIWEHGDEERHREVCDTADQLPDRIEAFRHQKSVEVPPVLGVCWQLFKLANLRPRSVVPAVSELVALLPSRLFGRLDDLEYLTAALALISGMSERQIGRWDSAESGYSRAVSGLARTADTTEVDRVEAERLALQVVRRNYATVVKAAPERIRFVVKPRERIKAQLTLAHALLNEGKPCEARSIIEAVQLDPILENEPALRAWLLTTLGNALSYLGRDTDAMSSFNAAGAVLSRFWYPQQLASLLGGVGEHLGRLGNLGDALAFYRVAQELYSVHSQPMLGYFRVLLAELLIQLGRNDEAEAELLAAIPLIEEFDLRREGVAAVALLREALSKRRTDVTAIQELRDQLRKGLH